MAKDRDQTKLERRRQRAARMFARGATQADVARTLSVSRVSAMRWHEQWRRGGPRGMARAGPLGRPRRLSETQWQRVERRLLKGPEANRFSGEIWTLERVAEVIEDVTGVAYHVHHVWRVLRRHGWSRQRPTTRARERNEERIQEWVKKDWPRVKKTPGTERSSSSTRAASRKVR